MDTMSRRRRSPADRLQIVVLGYLVRGPFGGGAWHHLQYVLGLHLLGHDVAFIEDSDDYESCYDPDLGAMTTDPSYGLRFAQDALGRLGFGERWAYHDAHTCRWHGPLGDRAVDWCRQADMVLNVSGVNPLRPWLDSVPARVLVDTDPGFTQLRHLADPAARERAASHTAFATFAENYGQPECLVPSDGFPWQPTRQPVVLEAWPLTPHPMGSHMTTVMAWESYPDLEHAGRRLGTKSASFAPYMSLPSESPVALELAVAGPAAPRAELARHGWLIADPAVVAVDPWTYRQYLQASLGEFSVAKHGYVTTNSGWFSERSAAYLASGRAVVTQETGFSRTLPTGSGLLAFRDRDESLAALTEVAARPEHHGRAARDLAAAHFAAEVVLSELLATVAASTSAAAAVEGSPGWPG